MRAWLVDRGGHLPYELDDYVALSDSTVLAELNKAASANLPGHDDAVRFRHRGHMRLAKELILADNFTMVKNYSGSRRAPDLERFKNLTLHVRKKFGTKKIIADAPDHSATKMFDKSRILVLLDGQTRYLDDISEIVRGMSSNIWRGRIYTDKADCEKVRVACDKWLASHSHNSEKGLGDGNK